jgi:hypothetical protein
MGPRGKSDSRRWAVGRAEPRIMGQISADGSAVPEK